MCVFLVFHKNIIEALTPGSKAGWWNWKLCSFFCEFYHREQTELDLSQSIFVYKGKLMFIYFEIYKTILKDLNALKEKEFRGAGVCFLL